MILGHFEPGRNNKSWQPLLIHVQPSLRHSLPLSGGSRDSCRPRRRASCSRTQLGLIRFVVLSCSFVFFKIKTNCFCFFPQQRKLMGSSAQISSGVCRCGSQEQVPEEGSGRFRRVPACAGVGSGVCWCRFRRQVPEGLRRQVPKGSGRFRRVPVYA